MPGLFVLGEANFSDHGANRLGASALMQGLADGYFVAPYTVANYLGGTALPAGLDRPRRLQGSGRGRSQARIDKVLRGEGHAHRPRVPPRDRHDLLGPRRHGPHRSRPHGRASRRSRQLRDEFWQDVIVPGDKNNLNPRSTTPAAWPTTWSSPKLLALDALERRESCGGHFREEFQTPDGEALRKDDEYLVRRRLGVQGRGRRPELHKEPLVFEEVHPSQRSYK